jgi:glutamine synthetase
MNPYLHLTGLLAAIADGIERDLPLPAEARVDVGHLSDGEAKEAGFQRLPTDLAVALDAFEADDALRQAVGPIVARHYVDVKRFEWALYLERSGLDAVSTEVSDWERRTYFEWL